jgi:hypothetical protein
MVSGMRLNMGNQMLTMRGPGGHRSIAGVELLQQLMAVNVGGTYQRGRRSRKGSGRCARSP